MEKALPYLEEEGTWWIEEKECVSCHHTALFVWAKDLALSAGYTVDPGPLTQQREWMTSSFLEPVKPNPKAKEVVIKEGEINANRNMEGVAQFLLSPSSKATTAEVRQTLLQAIASNQDEQNNWKPGGQLPRQKRPEQEIQWTSNQWADLALQGTGHHPETVGTTQKEGTPATTTEWYAMNLLLHPGAESAELLLERQNEDGGWSWIDGDPSGPLGTGQALFALGRSGTAKDFPEAIRKAKQFLVSTQSEDGRWKTLSTKNRSKTTDVSDFFGTAWATIGLLEGEPVREDSPDPSG